MKTDLRPFFTYFGGKYRIAKKYPKPRFIKLIEPFAGSAGYSLRYYNRNVILYDLNPQVYGTWQYLINVKESEIRRLPLVFDDVRDLDIAQEAKWVIGWWLNKGHTQPCNIPGQWMRAGAHANSFWGEAIRERIAGQIRCIRHWKVFNKSWHDITNTKASWFVDPPYQRSGKCYKFNQIDYKHLGRWVREINGQVIACGQLGDDWLPFKPFTTAKGTSGYKMSGISKEMIWVNR